MQLREESRPYMKKFYCVTILAAIAICTLQVYYVNNLYQDYIYRVSVDIDKEFQTAISRELSYRNHRMNPTKSNNPWRERIYMKWLSDMTPQEKDSLLRITQKGDTINVDEARKAGIGKTPEDISHQLYQDRALSKEYPVNVFILDSLFNDLSTSSFEHRILLYGRGQRLIDSIGPIPQGNPEFDSGLLPIGTKKLQYLQLQATIPHSTFIKQQLWTLALSASLIAIVMTCLLFQLIGLHRRDRLLVKRETGVNGIIHDLKAPLNNVITLLSWIKISELNAERKDLISEGQTGLKRLVNNIESLLTTARKDKQRIVLNRSEIDLLQITEWVKKELSTIYRDKPHTIEIINILPDKTTVVADALYIENVIRNLIENALKYSDEGVRITVTLVQKGKTVIVSVKDNGWGIPKQYQKKLFTQFFQVPRGKHNQKGYGIGLAQSRNIIQEHQGAIRVDSIENEGSTFSFSLPIT